MIYFPETKDTISTMSLRVFTLSSWGYARILTLCMLAFWSHEGVVFLDFPPSSHSVTSFLFPWLCSTDPLCPRLGDPVPLPPKWRPYSQGPRTLPYRDPEQIHFPEMHEVFKKWQVPLCRVLCKLGNGTNRKRGITSTVFKSISKNSEALVLRG
jgi:hypothetical protein